MKYNKYSNLEKSVSVLGYGAGHIGGDNLPDNEVEILLNQIVDLGINLIDTARGYGSSEERIGKFLSHRRKEIVLSTKVGYMVDGYEDWTYDCIMAGVERALKTLKTDYIDIVHLHSCPKWMLEKGDVSKALNRCKDEGLIKITGYSGENEDLKYAIESNQFTGIECSLNIADQRVINGSLNKIIDKNIGLIAKRPLANAPWRFENIPYGHYCEEYWHRLKTMNLDLGNLSWNEIALRFSAYTEGVSSVIVGSTNIEHIKKNVEIIEKGKLENNIYTYIREKFLKNDNNWIGQV